MTALCVVGLGGRHPTVPGSIPGAVGVRFSLVISRSMWGVISVLSHMRVWCGRFGPQRAYPHMCVVLAR